MDSVSEGRMEMVAGTGRNQKGFFPKNKNVAFGHYRNAEGHIVAEKAVEINVSKAQRPAGR